jgi:hypothetical protein
MRRQPRIVKDTLTPCDIKPAWRTLALGVVYSKGANMLILIPRPQQPDAVYWPGRRYAAAIDAIVWPVLWLVVLGLAPFETGVVGQLMVAVSLAAAPIRVGRAVWRNHRYRFTTLRWGRATAMLLVAGGALKVAAWIGAA